MEWKNKKDLEEAEGHRVRRAGLGVEGVEEGCEESPSDTRCDRGASARPRQRRAGSH